MLRREIEDIDFTKLYTADVIHPTQVHKLLKVLTYGLVRCLITDVTSAPGDHLFNGNIDVWQD